MSPKCRASTLRTISSSDPLRHCCLTHQPTETERMNNKVWVSHILRCILNIVQERCYASFIYVHYERKFCFEENRMLNSFDLVVHIDNYPWKESFSSRKCSHSIFRQKWKKRILSFECWSEDRTVSDIIFIVQSTFYNYFNFNHFYIYNKPIWIVLNETKFFSLLSVNQTKECRRQFTQ